MRTGDGLRLIDWDTVGLAIPERDLWEVLGPSASASASGGGGGGRSDAARRYTRATGHTIDPDGLRFYQIRWALDDLAAFTGQLRAGHQRTADAHSAWQALNETVAGVIRLAGT
jgi:spectinomycin phosphotransferase